MATAVEEPRYGAAELSHTIVLTKAYLHAGALELLRPANGVRLPRSTPATTVSGTGDRH